MKNFSSLMTRTARWLVPALGCGAQAFAASTDWGVIAVEQPTSIAFADSGIGQNFTDRYSFQLLSSADASSSVAVTFDPCSHGCGNPDLAYGIYDANGSLVDSVGSSPTTVQLAAGSYALQIRGTGMGAGNTLDYSGSVAFYSAAGMQLYASSVPEPADYLLLLTGSALLAWGVRRNRGARLAAGELAA